MAGAVPRHSGHGCGAGASDELVSHAKLLAPSGDDGSSSPQPAIRTLGQRQRCDRFVPVQGAGPPVIRHRFLARLAAVITEPLTSRDIQFSSMRMLLAMGLSSGGEARKASDKPSDYAPRPLRPAPDPARHRMWPDLRVPDFLGSGQTKSPGMACKRSAVRARLAPLVRNEIRKTRTASTAGKSSTAGKYSNGGRVGRRTYVRIGNLPPPGCWQCRGFMRRSGAIHLSAGRIPFLRARDSCRTVTTRSVRRWRLR